MVPEAMYTGGQHSSAAGNARVLRLRRGLVVCTAPQKDRRSGPRSAHWRPGHAPDGGVAAAAGSCGAPQGWGAGEGRGVPWRTRGLPEFGCPLGVSCSGSDEVRKSKAGQQRQQPAQPHYANYWAPLTCKRHTMPHPAQPRHTNHWTPRTRKRHQQEHRPQRPTERSDPTQHAKGRTGDCPRPRQETATTRRNVAQGVQVRVRVIS